MRIAILGNSGSGKSTLARWLAAHTGAALLDLDSVAWEPGQIAVPRPPDVASADVRAFCSGHERWVVEGCYAGLIGVALEYSPRLLFLNPGEAQCIANCRSRPWEEHKYVSREEQDARLGFLLRWVGEYYTRSGDMSLTGHRSCFAAYTGPKEELSAQPALEPPSAEILAWLG
ncbi:MAG TPA: shikimate kinase [Candidatus Kapabacteria bacterium]|nr:shikimate kinase [Candidatus Kapabacteria bacterium]